MEQQINVSLSVFLSLSPPSNQKIKFLKLKHEGWQKNYRVDGSSILTIHQKAARITSLYDQDLPRKCQIVWEYSD